MIIISRTAHLFLSVLLSFSNALEASVPKGSEVQVGWICSDRARDITIQDYTTWSHQSSRTQKNWLSIEQKSCSIDENVKVMASERDVPPSPTFQLEFTSINPLVILTIDKDGVTLRGGGKRGTITAHLKSGTIETNTLHCVDVSSPNTL